MTLSFEEEIMSLKEEGLYLNHFMVDRIKAIIRMRSNLEDLEYQFTQDLLHAIDQPAVSQEERRKLMRVLLFVGRHHKRYQYDPEQPI